MPRKVKATPKAAPKVEKIESPFSKPELKQFKVLLLLRRRQLLGDVNKLESEALKKADADDDVKAIVLRVDSPGGSALASDMIWRAIERVKTKKKVVASMGSVAGRNTLNVEPAPGSDSTSIQPRCSRTMPSTVASPMPVPDL